MHRIDSPNALPGGLFTEGDPITPVPATEVSADWLNAVQDEIANVITGCGVALDKAQNNQLAQVLDNYYRKVIATGTVTPRSLQDRAADWVNVRDYGAISDGVTDALAAFQAAVASGKTVYVPEGTYHLSASVSGLFVSSGMVFFPGPGSCLVLSLGRLQNVSGPAAEVPLVLYAALDGSDTVTGLAHGMTPAKAFATIAAALDHAKSLAHFAGQFSEVELRLGAGDWGELALGFGARPTTYPFSITVTSADTSDLARFDVFSISSSTALTVYAKDVAAGFFAVARQNNELFCYDVTLINTGSQPVAAFLAQMGASIHVLGTVTVSEAVTYQRAFFYAASWARTMPENGDAPALYPGMELVNAENVTTPYMYRAVTHSFAYCKSNVFDQLKVITKKWYVDCTSASTQTSTNTDIANNDGVGGVVVQQYGNSTAGVTIFADGRVHEWGLAVVTDVPVGYTANIVAVETTITFSAPPAMHLTWNNPRLLITTIPNPTTTTCPLGAYNLDTNPGDVSIRWEAKGWLPPGT